MAVVKNIPVVLCYHNITTGSTSHYSISPLLFEEQVKAIAKAGFTNVLPHHLLNPNRQVTARQVMFSFDDTRLSHYTIAAPVLEKYGYRGVFFIMTVAIGKKGYMTAAQIKDLSRRGHVIAAHTYDHANVKTYKDEDWNRQLKQPKELLEKITGKPVVYFAYPFGPYTREAINHLQQLGYTAAFQLDGKTDTKLPLFTIRRLLINGNLKEEYDF